MPLNVENNNRIAKNAIMLYIRMLFIMGISLYTSRVILSSLGFEDYGINNVVGGVVVLFTFLNNAMQTTTQRFLNYAIGEKSLSRINLIFCTSINIHLVIGSSIFILSETIGLWFFYNKINIPETRMFAALCVYQSSILSVIFLIISVPYNAVIIAHEKMSAFAIITVLDAVLRLFVAYAISLSAEDKLIMYAVLLLFIQIILCVIYIIYCRLHFPESKYRWCFDKNLFRDMFGFAGWSLIGSSAYVAFTQGLNVMLNVFFGPTINAARAIAVQVQMAILNLISNFQIALNPQIIKSYASGDLFRMHQLIFCSCRISFYLLLCIVLPLFMEVEVVLSMWLGDVPNHTSNFVRLMFCIMLVDTISNPFMISAQATGRIKNYQLILGTVQLLILPISYVLLKFGCVVEIVFLVHLCIVCIAQIIRLYLLRNLISLSIKEFVIKSLSKIMQVLVASILGSCFIVYLVTTVISINVTLRLTLYIIVVVIIVYYIGLTKGERIYINNKLRKK